mmetsp:Transcript_28659/g.81988  ORF Transcript_28659/g.81988 Transcript_28659/m.81988 type:complete len:475 (-) Transcript_28659:346-1770(-)
MAACAVLVYCVIVALSHRCALALRSRVTPEAYDVKPSRGTDWQMLANIQDSAYFGRIQIGGQNIEAMLDTGSFELIAFSRSCPNCGSSLAGFAEKASGTFKWGELSQVHSYGSGSCLAKDGYDTVAIKNLQAKNHPIWVAMDCQIPVLSQAAFGAIVGIGPPGQPVHQAEQELQAVEEMEERLRAKKEDIPAELIREKKHAQGAIKVARTKPALLESLGVRAFSVCLGRRPNSPGWLIWNDESRDGQVGVQRIPVVGKLTWGVSVKNVELRGLHGHDQDLQIGCDEGCGAVLDTGTSFFGLPTDMINKLAKRISNIGEKLDCSDLSRFPDLVMDVGGHHVRFPPSSYAGTYTGKMKADVERFMRAQKLAEGDPSCQLLVFDLGPAQKTGLGPMIVLGMPFFREYYTTFDLGRSHGDRSIFVSPASDSCQPEAEAILEGHQLNQSIRNTLRTVDASALQVPRWLSWGEHANGFSF